MNLNLGLSYHVFFNVGNGMFGRREEIRKWLSEVIEKFRQKGAVSPDKAVTAEELGLRPIFREVMKRRLGSSGIFVEVDGKYYLNEARLKEIEEQRHREEAALGSRGRLFMLRIARLVTAILAVVLLLASMFIPSLELRVLAILFVVVWLAITILRVYYLSRARKRLQGF